MEAFLKRESRRSIGQLGSASGKSLSDERGSMLGMLTNQRRDGLRRLGFQAFLREGRGPIAPHVFDLPQSLFVLPALLAAHAIGVPAYARAVAV